MNIKRVGTAYRMLFLFISGVILLGIWLTGFNKAHWVLYIPVVSLTFAGISGICPGLIFWRMFGFKDEPLRCNPSNAED